MSDIQKEAEKMATREYLARGIFGGEAKKNAGIVTGIKYFDFQGAVRYFFDKLTKEGFKVIKNDQLSKIRSTKKH